MNEEPSCRNCANYKRIEHRFLGIFESEDAIKNIIAKEKETALYLGEGKSWRFYCFMDGEWRWSLCSRKNSEITGVMMHISPIVEIPNLTELYVQRLKEKGCYEEDKACRKCRYFKEDNSVIPPYFHCEKGNIGTSQLLFACEEWGAKE